MSKKQLKVLLIEKDEGDAQLIRKMLGASKSTAFICERVTSLSKGLERLARKKPDVVLLGFSLPEVTDMEGISRLQSQSPRSPVIVLAGNGEEDRVVKALRSGAQDCLTKGFLNSSLLEQSIIFAVERKHAEADVPDTSGEIKAEKKPTEPENGLKGLLQHAPDAYFLTDDEGWIVDSNKAAEELTGYTKRELVGKNLFDINLLNPGEASHNLAQSIKSKATSSREFIFKCKDDRLVIAEVRSFPARVKGKKLVMSIARDDTNRREFEAAFLKSEERYRLVVENSREAIFIFQDGIIKFPNRRTIDIFGRFEGMADEDYLFSFFHHDDRKEISSAFKRILSGETTRESRQLRIINGRGREMWIKLNALAISWESRPAVLSFMDDITQAKSLEAQALQAQKMEAVGTLAGGIAHDFNNLLQTIRGYAELALMRHREDNLLKQPLEEIIRASDRGEHLTQQLLTFSRKIPGHREFLVLNREVERIAKILERTIPKMIRLELDLDRKLDMIDADPTQMEQLLINLAINARDAMPEGGRLLVKTENVLFENKYRQAGPDAGEAKHICLTISDTGCGMNAETLKRIYEPFFSTKESGKGTGLGLAMVYGIVKEHHGVITCDSKEGEGAIFKIYFPAAQSSVATLKVQDKEAPEGGTETILLVDDEQIIRDLGLETLGCFGYNVLTAPNGEEALETYKKRHSQIDLIILDLIMPGIGGKECLNKILAIDPSAKVIISSGYSTKGPMYKTLEEGAKGVIHKPYDIDKMLAMVRDILDGEAGNKDRPARK